MKGYFYDDLNDGKRGEKLVAAALRAKGHKVIDLTNDSWARANDIDFQLERANVSTTLEVKNDIRSAQTGNFFIEFFNTKNESHNYKGWYHYCSAAYICFVVEADRTAHIVEFDELRAAIERNHYRSGRSSNAQGYLLPRSDLEAFNSYYCLAI